MPINWDDYLLFLILWQTWQEGVNEKEINMLKKTSCS